MKTIINGKRYDTDTATVIAEKDVDHNGIYAGTDYIGVSPNGTVFAWMTSNGQDCHRDSAIIGEDYDAQFLDGMTILDEALAKSHNLFRDA
jgi:hypothetical protein